MGCNDGGINFIVIIVVVPNVTDRIVGGKLVYSIFFATISDNHWG